LSSGPSIPQKDRVSKRIEVYLPPNEREALDAHCERADETRTAVVRRAIRKELGLPEPKGDV
jgi:predicted DNA-binding protein